MALLTSVQAALSGVDLQAGDTAAAGGGDTFVNNGRTYFYAENGSGATIVITFDDTGSVDPGEATSFDPDVEASITTLKTMIYGPFPVKRFGTTVAVTYDGVTSLTVAAIQT